MNKEQEQRENANVKYPRIFISHHSADAELAKVFSEFLTEISHGMIKSFYSSDEKYGIPYGKDWFDKVTKEIDTSTDVICLITDTSVQMPWILYEAGYASSSLPEKNVFCVAINYDIDKCAGPFQRFQNCKYDVDHLMKLIIQLIEKIPSAHPKFESKSIRFQVKKFYNKLSKYCQKQSQIADNKNEIQVKCPLIVENVALHRKQIDNIEDLIRQSNDNDFSLLLLTSMFKEYIPWLYEIGLATYKSLKKARTKSEKQKAIDMLNQTIKNIEQMPEFGQLHEHPDDFNIIIQKIKSILESYLYPLECPKCNVKNKIEAKFCRHCGNTLK